ncbi:MAG TPA: ATP-binding cassette domain-containing protein, partial [Candidatus Hydrogenedentes bacterium]|nr:ATP-binding cassette domain-containing protein [Candidatus Hydrogenedentota bacterium]
METCLVLDNVSKRYGRTLAVDSLCLELRRGEVMGLLGPNGAGKSTTLGMVAGLVRKTSGRIELFGMDADRRFTEVIARMGVLVTRGRCRGLCTLGATVSVSPQAVLYCVVRPEDAA